MKKIHKHRSAENGTPINKSKGKRTALLLAVVIMAASFPMVLMTSEYGYSSGAVGEEFVKDGLKYKVMNEYDVQVTRDNYSGEITIPSTVEHSGTTYTVTSIGNNAFYDRTILTSITIPSSVTTIGDWVFYRCIGLTSITIPSSVTTIGSNAFYSCDGLMSITVETDNPNYSSDKGVLFDYHKMELIQYPAGKQDGSYVIPSSVTTIADVAFAFCTSLTSITIPSSVTSIGAAAFRECRGLTSITIPSSVTTIGEGAFQNCTRLTSITIPSSVTSIGDLAFMGCTDLIVIVPTSFTPGIWVSFVAFLLKTDSMAIISAFLNNERKIEMIIDPGNGKVVDTVTITDNGGATVDVTRSGGKWIFEPTLGTEFGLEIVTSDVPDEGDDGFWTTTNIVIVGAVAAAAILGLLYVFVIRKP